LNNIQNFTFHSEFFFSINFVDYVMLMRKDTRLSPLFCTASDEKLGKAWEQGYISRARYVP